MPGLRVLVILVSVIVLTEGQNNRGSPPQFLGRRIPYDLLVYFGNEVNEVTTQPPTTTTPATTTTTAATTTAATANTSTNGSDATTGGSVTTEASSTVPGSESSGSTVAETTVSTTPTAAVTTDPTTTVPPTSTNQPTTAPSTTQTTQATTGTGGGGGTKSLLMAGTDTGTVTTSTAERVSTGATGPGNPGASQASAQTAGGADSTETPAVTTGSAATPTPEELIRNLTTMLIPIYSDMPAYVSVEALDVHPYNFTQSRSNEMLGYRGVYRLELDAANLTNCLAWNSSVCNITVELLKRNGQVANLSLGGYPVHQKNTTDALNEFIRQESSKSLGSACQAGQPCLSYGPKYTCRLNQSEGAVSCHDVCRVPNYCDGGTCLSNNVENGTEMCRCPDQTVHNGHTCLNWWIVIGPSIGGAALLLIMIFVVIGLAIKLGRTDQKNSLKPSPSFTDSLRRYEMVGGQENRAYTPDPTSQDAASPQTFKYETPGTTPGASAPGPTEAATLPLVDRGQPQDKAPANGVANGRSSLEMQDYPYQPSGAPPSRTYAQEVEDIMQSEAAKNFYPKLDHIDPKQDYSIRRPQLNTGTSYGDQVARF